MNIETCIRLEDEFTEEELKNLRKLPEAAFTDLIRMIESVNNMSEEGVRYKLRSFQVSTQDGSDLKQLLKDTYKKIIPASINVCLHKDLLPYYVIVDFEATCERINPHDYKHEIIEFPAVIIDSNKQEIKDCFQMFCKPKINPIVSEFCTSLTGITQEQIESAETFDKVLEHFQKWLQKNNIGGKGKYAIVTDGPWDMSRFLFSQCHYSNVKFPSWGKNWVNLRKTFKMNFEGRPHCGLDDAKNISRILLKMIYDGANVQINERIAAERKFKLTPKCNNNEVGNLMEKQKLEAHYASVYYLEKMPVYKEARRRRHIAEVQIGKAISEKSNLLNVSELIKTFSKKKSKKTKRHTKKSDSVL